METLQRDGCHSLAVTKVSFFVKTLGHPSHGLIIRNSSTAAQLTLTLPTSLFDRRNEVRIYRLFHH